MSTDAGSSWRAGPSQPWPPRHQGDAEERHSRSGGATEIAQRSQRRWPPRKRSACTPWRVRLLSADLRTDLADRRGCCQRPPGGRAPGGAGSKGACSPQRVDDLHAVALHLVHTALAYDIGSLYGLTRDTRRLRGREQSADLRVYRSWRADRRTKPGLQSWAGFHQGRPSQPWILLTSGTSPLIINPRPLDLPATPAEGAALGRLDCLGGRRRGSGLGARRTPGQIAAGSPDQRGSFATPT